MVIFQVGKVNKQLIIGDSSGSKLAYLILDTELEKTNNLNHRSSNETLDLHKNAIST